MNCNCTCVCAAYTVHNFSPTWRSRLVAESQSQTTKNNPLVYDQHRLQIYMEDIKHVLQFNPLVLFACPSQITECLFYINIFLPLNECTIFYFYNVFLFHILFQFFYTKLYLRRIYNPFIHSLSVDLKMTFPT